MIDSAGTLLGIMRPEDLFPGDVDKAKKLFRDLSRRWHPDKPDGSTEVFAHIADLYATAILKLKVGDWDGSAVLNLEDAAGKTRTFAIRASAPFELGRSLVGDDHATYIIDTHHAHLLDHAYNAPRLFTYASNKMRQEFERYLPHSPRSWRMADGRLVLQVDKTPDLIRLRDIVTHIGALESRHISWIVSGLLNLACYLSHAGIVHHDISPDTYFVSPNFHSGALLGGWWYARNRGERILVVPKRTYNLLPFKARMRKVASAQTDLELIRATARECIDGGAPVPMQAWLGHVGQGSAVEQYHEWGDVLERSFGKRRFIKLPVDADLVYGAGAVRS